VRRAAGVRQGISMLCYVGDQSAVLYGDRYPVLYGGSVCRVIWGISMLLYGDQYAVLYGGTVSCVI
jgi:hypothetical protein